MVRSAERRCRHGGAGAATPTLRPTVNEFEVVLFDLGGVLVDLGGLDAFLARHRLDPQDFWVRWLGAGAVGEFERGGCTAEEFADTFVAEFDLSIGPGQFLAEFARWPGGLLPGAATLLADVPVTRASLSNTNQIHWDGAFTSDELLNLFDVHFPSFRLGLAKPDPAIFRRVVELLGVASGRVVFLDDNQVNVDAATSVGLVARRVVGPTAARNALRELRVIA